MASAILTLHFCSVHDILFSPALQEWLSFSQVQIEHTFGKAMRLKESDCPRCTTITPEVLHKAVADAVSSLRITHSLWFLGVRRETNVMFSSG
jgi:hypothetical protein